MTTEEIKATPFGEKIVAKGKKANGQEKEVPKAKKGRPKKEVAVVETRPRVKRQKPAIPHMLVAVNQLLRSIDAFNFEVARYRLANGMADGLVTLYTDLGRIHTEANAIGDHVANLLEDFNTLKKGGGG